MIQQASSFFMAPLVAQLVKNLPATWETGFDPWVGKVPWRREQLPTPVFWPGEVHGQKNLADYGPGGHKESDTTERLSLSLSGWLREPGGASPGQCWWEAFQREGARGGYSPTLVYKAEEEMGQPICSSRS